MVFPKIINVISYLEQCKRITINAAFYLLVCMTLTMAEDKNKLVSSTSHTGAFTSPTLTSESTTQVYSLPSFSTLSEQTSGTSHTDIFTQTTSQTVEKITISEINFTSAFSVPSDTISTGSFSSKEASSTLQTLSIKEEFSTLTSESTTQVYSLPSFSTLNERTSERSQTGVFTSSTSQTVEKITISEINFTSAFSIPSDVISTDSFSSNEASSTLLTTKINVERSTLASESTTQVYSLPSFSTLSEQTSGTSDIFTQTTSQTVEKITISEINFTSAFSVPSDTIFTGSFSSNNASSTLQTSSINVEWSRLTSESTTQVYSLPSFSTLNEQTSVTSHTGVFTPLTSKTVEKITISDINFTPIFSIPSETISTGSFSSNEASSNLLTSKINVERSTLTSESTTQVYSLPSFSTLSVQTSETSQTGIFSPSTSQAVEKITISEISFAPTFSVPSDTISTGSFSSKKDSSTLQTLNIKEEWSTLTSKSTTQVYSLPSFSTISERTSETSLTGVVTSSTSQTVEKITSSEINFKSAFSIQSDVISTDSFSSNETSSTLQTSSINVERSTLTSESTAKVYSLPSFSTISERTSETSQTDVFTSSTSQTVEKITSSEINFTSIPSDVISTDSFSSKEASSTLQTFSIKEKWSTLTSESTTQVYSLPSFSTLNEQTLGTSHTGVFTPLTSETVQKTTISEISFAPTFSVPSDTISTGSFSSNEPSSTLQTSSINVERSTLTSESTTHIYILPSFSTISERTSETSQNGVFTLSTSQTVEKITSSEIMFTSIPSDVISTDSFLSKEASSTLQTLSIKEKWSTLTSESTTQVYSLPSFSTLIEQTSGTSHTGIFTPSTSETVEKITISEINFTPTFSIPSDTISTGSFSSNKASSTLQTSSINEERSTLTSESTTQVYSLPSFSTLSVQTSETSQTGVLSPSTSQAVEKITISEISFAPTFSVPSDTISTGSFSSNETSSLLQTSSINVERSTLTSESTAKVYSLPSFSTLSVQTSERSQTGVFTSSTSQTVEKITSSEINFTSAFSIPSDVISTNSFSSKEASSTLQTLSIKEKWSTLTSESTTQVYSLPSFSTLNEQTSGTSHTGVFTPLTSETVQKITISEISFAPTFSVPSDTISTGSFLSNETSSTLQTSSINEEWSTLTSESTTQVYSLPSFSTLSEQTSGTSHTGIFTPSTSETVKKITIIEVSFTPAFSIHSFTISTGYFSSNEASSTLQVSNLSKVSSTLSSKLATQVYSSPSFVFCEESSSTFLLSLKSSISLSSVLSKTIPPSREIKFIFKIVFTNKFNDNLKNPSSEEYKNLYKVFLDHCFSIFHLIPGFVKVIITGFEKGSIVVNSLIVFDKNEVKRSNAEVSGEIMNRFMKSMRQSNDSINGYNVDINKIKVDLENVSPSLASWIIVLVVALVILFALVTVIFFQKRKIREFKDRIYVTEHFSAGSFYPDNKSNFEMLHVHKEMNKETNYELLHVQKEIHKETKTDNEVTKNGKEHAPITNTLFYGDIESGNVENSCNIETSNGHLSEKYNNLAYISDD
nr:mucin-3A isoform X1 [Hydra vulgaris]